MCEEEQEEKEEEEEEEEEVQKKRTDGSHIHLYLYVHINIIISCVEFIYRCVCSTVHSLTRMTHVYIVLYLHVHVHVCEAHKLLPGQSVGMCWEEESIARAHPGGCTLPATPQQNAAVIAGYNKYMYCTLCITIGIHYSALPLALHINVYCVESTPT